MHQVVRYSLLYLAFCVLVSSELRLQMVLVIMCSHFSDACSVFFVSSVTEHGQEQTEITALSHSFMVHGSWFMVHSLGGFGMNVVHVVLDDFILKVFIHT
jgi:hypothetical protein